MQLCSCPNTKRKGVLWNLHTQPEAPAIELNRVGKYLNLELADEYCAGVNNCKLSKMPAWTY